MKQRTCLGLSVTQNQSCHVVNAGALWSSHSILSGFPQRTTLPSSSKSDGDPLKVYPKLPSSAGEDRATLLGMAMMASSVLMFFLLGTTVLKPFMLSSHREESNCTAIDTHIADDWLDFAFTCEGSCQDQGGYPCLQVFVNLSHSGQKALLHYDDEAVRTNPKCFYTPKCHRDRSDLLNRALDIKEFFDHKNETFPCFYSPSGQLGVVLRRSGHKVVFHCLFWPLLTLLGGALIVGLVKLTQHLSFQCEQYRTVVRAQSGGRAHSECWRRSTLSSVAKSQARNRALKRAAPAGDLITARHRGADF
ncbi:calcium-activated potassium channel subunit beta-3 [Acomys russatus]|uniref:calcium-activated potassium channel subunit beta-3 n=1 Tax=Acomys russatus TaxID=60746 RepID=UPI0021E2E4B5|nr:calcium-activated potassium channel subunit beta-3 [Acomys russatus]